MYLCIFDIRFLPVPPYSKGMVSSVYFPFSILGELHPFIHRLRTMPECTVGFRRPIKKIQISLIHRSTSGLLKRVEGCRSYLSTSGVAWRAGACGHRRAEWRDAWDDRPVRRAGQTRPPGADMNRTSRGPIFRPAPARENRRTFFRPLSWFSGPGFGK